MVLHPVIAGTRQLVPSAAATSAASSPVPLIASLAASLAIFGYILYRTRQVRVVRARLALPVVLTIAGLGGLTGATRAAPMTAAQTGILAALLVFDAVGLGVVRAMTARLWREGEAVLSQGRWVTVALWLAGFAIHAGVDAAAHINSASQLLYIGITLGAQRLVLTARARRLTG